MPMPAMAVDTPAPGTSATDLSGAPLEPLDPFEPLEPLEPLDPFDRVVPGEASALASDPFAVPMPTLRPDPFGLTPPTPDGRDQMDGIDGFVVDVLEGPLTDAAVAYAIPDDASTDWTGLRDAAAVANALPAAVLRDSDRIDTTIDDTTIEPLDTAPILWHAPHDTTATSVVPGGLHPPAELHPPKQVAPFLPAGTGWQIGGLFPATAMADDGALSLRRADTRWALSDLVAAGDVTIEMALDYRAGAGFGMLFRASVDEHERVTGYSFDFDPATGGGGYLLQQWADNRPHWRPIVQVPVTDPAGLYGRHIVALTVQGDRLTVCVDAETVLTVAALSRASIDLGREACRGDGLGVHAGATTELTVETFRAAQP
jgi:hypothetical protein